MSTEKTQNSFETTDINDVFVEGADFKSGKLEDTKAINRLIEDTLVQQVEILKLNQMDQEELRTVVQL